MRRVRRLRRNSPHLPAARRSRGSHRRRRRGKAHDVALGISGDHRVEHILSTFRAVDIAIAHDAALQHAELVEQEVWVVAGAVEMPVLCCAFVIAMGRADLAVHVLRNVIQPVASMKAVNPRSIQLGQRRPVLWEG